jgi:hypothetical protein
LNRELPLIACSASAALGAGVVRGETLGASGLSPLAEQPLPITASARATARAAHLTHPNLGPESCPAIPRKDAGPASGNVPRPDMGLAAGSASTKDGMGTPPPCPVVALSPFILTASGGVTAADFEEDLPNHGRSGP